MCISNNKRSITMEESNDVIKSPNKKKVKTISKDGQIILDSGMLKISETPYLNFCKEFKPQVLKENIGSSFEAVALLLRQKWSNLSDEEKQKYGHEKEICQRPEIKTKEVKRNVLKNFSRKSDKVSISSVLEKLLSHSKTSSIAKENSIPRKTVSIPFSLADLKEKNKHNYSESTIYEDEFIHLIGQLQSNGAWLLQKGTEICLINHFRMEETLLYLQMMNKHIIPLETLESPQDLQISLLHQQILMKLKVKSCSSFPFKYIDDERITSNGFEIRVAPDELNSTFTFQITKMASCISYFGLSDLMEILEHLNKNFNIDLADCRPFKIVNYIKSETVRMARQVLAWFPKADILELLHHSEIKLLKEQCCIHQRPFLYPVYDLSSVKYHEDIDFSSLQSSC